MFYFTRTEQLSCVKIGKPIYKAFNGSITSIVTSLLVDLRSSSIASLDRYITKEAI